MARIPLDALNAAPASAFAAELGGVFEHAPWVAAAAAARRPFASLAALFAALREVVGEASRERRVELLRGIPNSPARPPGPAT